MKLAAALVVGVVAASLLGGCVSDDEPTQTAGEDATDVPEPTTGPPTTQDPVVTPSPPSTDYDDETAAIEGIVTDDEARPLADVLVKTRAFSTTTGPDGRYGFGGLDPGTYNLWAGLDGYLPSTTQIKVEAGELTSGVDIILAPAPAEIQYHSVEIRQGFIGCGYGLVAAGDPCITQAKTMFPFDLEDAGIVSAILFELVWSPGLSVADNGQVLLLDIYPAPPKYHAEGFTSGALTTQGWVYGQSPLVLSFVEHTTMDMVYGRAGPHSFKATVRAFGGNTTDFQQHPGNTTYSGVVFQQTFDLYVTYFYYGAHPEPGYTARP